MRSSILVAVSAVLGLAVSQADLPTCAVKCIGNVPPSCNNDPGCICKDSSYISGVSCCVSQQCQAGDQQSALNYARNLCQPYGAVLPSSAGCASGSGTGAGASSTSMSGSMTMTDSSMSMSMTSSMSMTGSMTSSTAVGGASGSSSATSSSSSGVAGKIVAAENIGIVGALLGAVALL